MCEAFDYGIELKKQGKLLPRQYNVNPFADVTCEEEGGLLF